MLKLKNVKNLTTLNCLSNAFQEKVKNKNVVFSLLLLLNSLDPMKEQNWTINCKPESYHLHSQLSSLFIDLLWDPCCWNMIFKIVFIIYLKYVVIIYFEYR